MNNEKGIKVLTMRGAADSGLLARVVGIFAQLDLPPPAMQVRVDGDTMEAVLMLDALGSVEQQAVNRKIAAFVGVDSCIAA